MRSPRGRVSGRRSPASSRPRRERSRRGSASSSRRLGAAVLVAARFGTEAEQGAVVRRRGTLAEPDPWRADALRRHGIALVLSAERVEATDERRGGVSGRIDAVRARAERGLERGMPPDQAALARGFVLGQDDLIDPATREDFRRSGLAHLLAVSGQNVMLLCLLAWPFMALAGLPLRARLLALLALIAVYVPVAGRRRLDPAGGGHGRRRPGRDARVAARLAVAGPVARRGA